MFVPRHKVGVGAVLSFFSTHDHVYTHKFIPQDEIRLKREANGERHVWHTKHMRTGQWGRFGIRKGVIPRGL